MMKLRQSTVEPVLGTLINFLAMRRVNTRGIKLANKCIMMTATAYNLKKMMKFKFNRSIAAITIDVDHLFALYVPASNFLATNVKVQSEDEVINVVINKMNGNSRIIKVNGYGVVVQQLLELWPVSSSIVDSCSSVCH